MTDANISWGDITTVAVPLASVVIGAVLWIVKLVGEIKDSLAAFKQEVAKEYASLATLEKFEMRLLSSIDKLGDRLDRRLPDSHSKN